MVIIITNSYFALARDELQQSRNFEGQTKGFRPRAPKRVCFNCGRKGHLHFYCNENPDPRDLRLLVKAVLLL